MYSPVRFHIILQRNLDKLVLNIVAMFLASFWDMLKPSYGMTKWVWPSRDAVALSL